MNGSSETFLVCTTKQWNIDAFYRRTPNLPGKWILIQTPDALDPETVKHLNPRYIFFPHWSWRVPDILVDTCECVCFHMADVPYGRGGSPLQNLIVRGHRETKLTALRMVAELDAGPVYMKRPLDLSGRAQDIFERQAELVYDMAAEMIACDPVPQPQSGPPTLFKRRTPAQSELPKSGTSEELYDFIRMLDADTYPHAFVDWGDWRLEFSHAQLAEDGTVDVRAVIRSRKEPT